MNIEIPYLKDLPLHLQQAILITCGSLVICSVLLFFAVLPARTRLQAVRTEIAGLNGTFVGMEKDISGTTQQQAKTAASMADVEAFAASGPWRTNENAPNIPPNSRNMPDIAAA